MKNDEFANIRYDKELVSTSNHPIIIEAINKNLTKTKLKTIIVNTQKYLINSNQLIYLYIIILIYIQTSIPEYTVNSKSLESRKSEYPHVENASFDDLVAKCDILSFHCKAAADGKPMLTKEHMKKMKPTSYIINAARGNIVDENDLNDALNEGLIAGAAVDVFSKEPAKENILFNNSKAVLTPHIAASTTEASIVVAEMVANQISDFLLNGVKKNTV